MHFVSAQTQEEQISEILSYFKENLAKSVDSVHAKHIENFEETLNKLEESEDISGILDYLISLREVISNLPTSHKNTPITIQRVILLILPLLKLQDESNKKNKEQLARLENQINQICDIIEQSQYALPIKINSVLLIYSIFSETSSMRSVSFQRLYQLCDKNDQIKIIVENLRNVQNISKEWNLNLDQRRKLLKSSAHTLDRNNESAGAFEVMQGYLRTFERSDEKELTANLIEVEAKRCVILAIKVPTVIDFADILKLKAVKYLQAKDKVVFDFMSLFTSTDTKEFTDKVQQFQTLITEEHLQMDEIIKKKQYIQICNLKLDSSNHSYSDLANILNISIDEVEIWAIEAIASGILDAKVDQLKEEIVIKSHALNQEWQSIQDRIGEWKKKFQEMQAILQHTQQLSSAVVKK